MIKTWLLAARPKTLAAAIVPVMVGAGLAYQQETLLWLPSLVALFCAVMIQVGTNFANDYYDHKSGADNDGRIGFTRATSGGMVAPEAMKTAAIISMAVAFLAGMYLVWHGGWVILLIGILSIIFGIAYTGGPFPLAYNGLGDVFVFVFFGFVAVMGTYYVNALEWSMLSFWASLAVGALCVNILVVNNLRDVEQDEKAGKRTLGVFFGEKFLKLEYLLMMMLAYSIPPHFLFREGFSWPVLLPLLLLPFAIKLVWAVFNEKDKPKLNRVLELTAMFMLLFGTLFTAGIVLG